ncbi:hypothetical protein RhiirC2_769992 [Rhizophagus irregularis]|uniref:NrS-1 polymerase-like helicase domain-containing protein n=1 Tax=Rhizophagus irregularis TaxID=588596 RepID=A0A2N1NXP1_9GLOM|nr:hypothetical protein RhiirC2_769992 [Rhizophagus irregularis]
MIHPSNDESEVIKSSLLNILELKVKIYDNTNSKIDQAEFKLVEELLKKASIEGFNLSYPSESSPNSLQARKLIIINEIGMSSGEWHKFNGYFKSLITEGRVTIERKDLKTKQLKDFAGYMVTNNQNALIKIDIGDSCVVCFNVSPYYKRNTKYFKRLENMQKYQT